MIGPSKHPDGSATWISSFASVRIPLLCYHNQVTVRKGQDLPLAVGEADLGKQMVCIPGLQKLAGFSDLHAQILQAGAFWTL